MSDETTTNDQQLRVEHLTSQVARGLADIAELDQRTVRGYRAGRGGGAYTVAYAQRRTEMLTNLIDQDVEDGSTRHDRISRGVKLLALLPLATDFIIVGLFLALVFDVSLSAPLDTPAETLTTLVMTTIVTVGLAVTLRWIGTTARLDSQSEDASSPARRTSSGSSRDSSPGSSLVSSMGHQALLVLLLGLVAAVVLVRVAGDAAAAGINLGTGWVLAVFLAVIIAALNWIIYAAEARDGSDATHELDHWGAVLMPVAAERRELFRRVRRAQEELERIDARRQKAPVATEHPSPTSSILVRPGAESDGRSTIGFG